MLQVLAHWQEQGHKALLFTQTQQMLDILEGAVQAGISAFACVPPSAITCACLPPWLLPVPACNQGHRLTSQAVLHRCLHAVCTAPCAYRSAAGTHVLTLAQHTHQAAIGPCSSRHDLQVAEAGCLPRQHLSKQPLFCACMLPLL